MTRFVRLDLENNTLMVNFENVTHMIAQKNNPEKTKIHFGVEHSVVVPENIETLARIAETANSPIKGDLNE